MKMREMLELIDKGESPLDISIKKWEDIVNGVGNDEGLDNCALCYVYSNGDGGDDDCDCCPVKMDTGEPYCAETPFQRFGLHVTNCEVCDLSVEPEKYCSNAIELAKVELEYLKSLKSI